MHLNIITTKWIAIAAFVLTWLIVGTLGFRSIRSLPVPAGSTLHAEMLKLFSYWMAALGIIFSTLLTSFNSLEATANQNAKIAFDRIDNAFKYMERWDSGAIREARDATRQIKDLSHSTTWNTNQVIGMIDDPKGLTNGNPDNLRRSVISMFNYFQEMELSIEANRVNADYLKVSFGETYVDIFERFKPWLDVHRKEDQENYKDLQALKKRWSHD